MTREDLTPAAAYLQMLTIRASEEKTLELSREGLVAGSVHLCLGQEAIPVGAAAALGENDVVLSTYRGHGWALALGSSLTAVLGEIAQRAGGTNGGRGGSALLSDPDTGFLGENSIVGAGYPIAAGVGVSSRLLGSDRVTLTSIGDGAMNQGASLEGMIFAAARNLPVVFLCENNGWAEMTPLEATTRSADLVERARGLGIDSRIVDGGDPFAVRDAVAEAAAACRRGEGPVFLELKTVRLSGHYNKDIQHYRPREDQEAAEAADPIARFRARALGEGLLTEAECLAAEAEALRAVAEAETAVRAMPLPDTAGVFEHLYAEPVTDLANPDVGETKNLTYQRAVNLALRTELERRPETILYGEDVGFAGGIFGVSRGLHREFGDERVFDTPIAEAAILGSAVGAAMTGARPIVEIMWADFTFVAFDQIINQASNVRYISRGRLSAPLTIRMQQGVTAGSCAQHSQSIEAFFAHIPGIKVGLPATPQDAYDMLRAAVADPDPTVVIEARSLYQMEGEVNPNGPLQRVEGARTHREGADLVIFTWGAMLGTVLEAAELLESTEGISARVVDLRWLRPLDDAAIAEAILATGGRVLIVHEATTTGGFGAEVAARIGESQFENLDGPVLRLGTPDIRMPSAPNLQDAVLPGIAAILAAARRAVA
ncbi:alpha-ketoacid dehydrogenase subunit alpha/beta [Mycetocola spongiae]|uniref:alpha-ketoacid dehydrogenase subunit alpha/beta n=1 Tax=Mycetocola spongiae TaxID=2859226 RepID=UPI001CF3E79A|nr:alpha-ketoacid dehydrogenase subunit alpha/beta [Mycetocola spongiae]UCR88187.1 transketolase [Mycetocola spongiae]